ncbi:MAG: carbamoyltransferase HypF, partial [Actinobacteria bacterium]|nr:carbamoyltransferase HypF [Actinomycetota bacterium]
MSGIRNFNTYSINIKGIVQGVGFRPFIWQLFNKFKICGMVTNTTEGVYIEANFKDRRELLKLIEGIKRKKPAPSLIETVEYFRIADKIFSDFTIAKSLETDEKFQLVSPDIATCRMCISDINDADNSRRFGYAFTNCTNCGPRFTIIKSMPYDRHSTTMKKFRMCPECLAEYNDPEDRRFHAQPNACKKCGPCLVLVDAKGTVVDFKDSIASACSLIKKGRILGLKSLGGFQIACDATSGRTVAKLRKRKNRPSKPFAVMFKDIEMIKKYLKVSPEEERSLLSPAAPIVLLKKKNSTGENTVHDAASNIPLSGQVSFYNNYEGAILPYTPIHHLLFKYISIPLVMTSGNISEEPIASGNNEALDRLKDICDFFLIHDRDINSKYDDSVLKIISNKEMAIRRARGMAPYPLKLDIDIGGRVVLAAGAQEKNTFCLLVKNYAIVSQHIGDLDSPESYRFFKDTLDNYMKLFGISNIDIVAYDKHPDYMSSRFAASSFKKARKIAVQHHSAHIAGVIAENRLLEKDAKNILGFSWDGTGFGDDGKVWGSEIFLISPGMDFTRIGHLKEKLLPGGDAAIKRPYRMALAYLYSLWLENYSRYYKEFMGFVNDCFPFYKKNVSSSEIEILCSQLKTGYNSPVTTSMGRFFDAVSSILNLAHISTYEGEAAIRLEMAADMEIKKSYDLKITDSAGNPVYLSWHCRDTDRLKSPGKESFAKKAGKTYFEINDSFIINQVIEDIKKGTCTEVISAKFHNTLVKIITGISLMI